MNNYPRRETGGERPPEREFYSLSEVAERLGVHYETAARWVRSGKLPGKKLSRRKVVVPREEVDAFLAGESADDESGASIETGSPRRWLSLVGTLTPEEAEQLREAVQDFEKVETDA